MPACQTSERVMRDCLGIQTEIWKYRRRHVVMDVGYDPGYQTGYKYISRRSGSWRRILAPHKSCLSIGLGREEPKGVITERNNIIHDKFAL